MKTGEIIQKLRKERKMTQDQLANLLGYRSKSTICKIENDEIDLTKNKLSSIANIFGVDINTLMGDKQEQSVEKIASIYIKEAFGQHGVDIMSSFSKLNPAGQQKAVEDVADLTEIPKYRK